MRAGVFGAAARPLPTPAHLTRPHILPHQFPFNFAAAREGKLLADLITAFKDADGDGFSNAVYNYDQISKLDPWKTTVLLKVKAHIDEANGGGGGGGGGGEEDGGC